MVVRLLRILAALSLVLCAAAVAMWVWTAGRVEGLRYNSANQTWLIYAGPGGVTATQFGSGFSELEIYDAWHTVDVPAEYVPDFDGSLTPPAATRLLGFAWRRETFGVGGGVTQTEWLVRVPHWFIVLVAAIPPLLWLRATLERRRRRMSHQCLTCGYDLRATPDRCPECGMAAAAA